MRWKLLIAASLIAAAAGAGAALSVTHFLPGAAWRGAIPGWAATVALLLPLVSTAFAAVFIYRHTSRRRALQAAATALLAIALMLAVLFTAFYFLAPRPTPPTDALPFKNI